MHIITPNSELFEYTPFHIGGQALYHSGEVSLLVRVYEGVRVYTAARKGKVNGLYYDTGMVSRVPVPTNRQADQGPLIPEHLTLADEGAPTLGKIPTEHKELLVEAITRLTAYDCYRYKELISQLIQAKHRLEGQK